MKAMVVDGQFGLDFLKLIDRPQPQPRRGEVIVRMRAVSLNYRDTDMVAGTYPYKFPLPLCPTSDGVGEVVAVGEDVRAGEGRRSRHRHLLAKLDWRRFRSDGEHRPARRRS